MPTYIRPDDPMYTMGGETHQDKNGDEYTEEAVAFLQSEFKADDEDKICALLQELEDLRYSLDGSSNETGQWASNTLGGVIRRFERVLNVQFYPTEEELKLKPEWAQVSN